MTTETPDSLSPGTHTVTIGGIPQRYHVYGSGPVCLVHPGGPGFHWEYLRMPLVEQNMTTVYIEPIGTGASGQLPSHPNGYTREQYAQAIDGILDHLNVGRVHLLGHSHGAFVAQYYAASRGPRLAGVVLYESAVAVGLDHYTEAAKNLDDFAGRHAGDPRLDDVMNAWQDIPSIKDNTAFTSVARRLFPAYLADYWAHETRYDPIRSAVSGSYISGLDDCLAPETIDDRTLLPSITVPTLVIVGREDFICGPRWATEIHALVPGSTLEVMEHSGHFAHFEEPEAFVEVVSSFVKGTTPDGA
ncbi:alpha/beta fold hydrolase [Actinoplanes sp. NPDC000266]